MLKKHERTSLMYQGSYENHFLDYCFDNNINVEKGSRINYKLIDKEHYYFLDFYLRDFNLIVEVKSLYIYELHLEKNIEKEKQYINDGYHFIFLMDKNYDELNIILYKNIFKQKI